MQSNNVLHPFHYSLNCLYVAEQTAVVDNFKNLSVAKIAEPEFISDVQEMVLVE